MKAHFIRIDAEEMTDLLCATLVCRLRELKWPAGEAAMAADKALKMVYSRMEDIQVQAAQDMGRIAAGGGNEAMMQNMARAVFAVEGIKIADELNKSRLAGLN
jgi:hypothetical protein